MEENWYMKKPCKGCPFRKDVTPYLKAERAEELAYHATNPYNTFTCHKTTVEDEESEEGEMMTTEESKECAGFMTLQYRECENNLPEGFEPALDLVYEDAWDMTQAYIDEEENNK